MSCMIILKGFFIKTNSTGKINYVLWSHTTVDLILSRRRLNVLLYLIRNGPLFRVGKGWCTPFLFTFFCWCKIFLFRFFLMFFFYGLGLTIFLYLFSAYLFSFIFAYKKTCALLPTHNGSYLIQYNYYSQALLDLQKIFFFSHVDIVRPIQCVS